LLRYTAKSLIYAPSPDVKQMIQDPGKFRSVFTDFVSIVVVAAAAAHLPASTVASVWSRVGAGGLGTEAS